VHGLCDFKPKERYLNSPKNAYFRTFRLFYNFSPISTHFGKNEDFLPDSFGNLLAERIFLLEKQAVKFIPLWKNRKKLLLMNLIYLLCSKLVLPSGIFNFFTAAPSKLQVIIELTFCTCNGI